MTTERQGTTVENNKFVPELSKMYHLHIHGIPKCFIGTIIAVTRDWAILESEDGVQHSVPLDLVVKADELVEEAEADADKLAALKTLFPGMPDELNAELLKVLDLVKAGDASSLDVMLKAITIRH